MEEELGTGLVGFALHHRHLNRSEASLIPPPNVIRNRWCVCTTYYCYCAAGTVARQHTSCCMLSVSNFAHSTLIYSHTLMSSHSHTLTLTPSHSHTHTLTLTPYTLTAGTASHSLDYRKAAGAFIHGFRYTGTVL